MNRMLTLSRKPRMDAKDMTGTDAKKIVEELRRFPNPNAVWAAFRAEIIDEETARELTHYKVRTLRQRLIDLCCTRTLSKR